jgi:PPOX class probable F420-dependent enzyme
MSPKEIEDFLNEKNVARIATVKPNNSPHVSPVWYLWDNKLLFMSIGENSVKANNIRQNNQVSVTIDNCTYPGKGVIIEGEAEIKEFDERLEWEISRRYLEPRILDQYLKYARTKWRNVILVVHPTKIISWDSSKDPNIGKLFSN